MGQPAWIPKPNVIFEYRRNILAAWEAQYPGMVDFDDGEIIAMMNFGRFDGIWENGRDEIEIRDLPRKVSIVIRE